MDLLDYLLYLGPTLGPLIFALAFRKRIGKAFARMILSGTPEFIEEFLWEEAEQVLDGKKVKVKILRKPVAAQLEALAPALVTPILKSIKIKVPENLPINPTTGQLDFAVPLMQKLASGKKVSAMDLLGPFMPTLMEVGQVVGSKFQDAIAGFVNKGVKPGAEKVSVSPQVKALTELKVG